MKFLDSDINRVVFNTLIDYKELDISGVATLKCRLLPSNINEHSGVISSPQYVIELLRSRCDNSISIEEVIADSYQLPIKGAGEIYEQWKANISVPISAFVVVINIDGVGELSIDRCNSVYFRPSAALLAELNPLQRNIYASMPQPDLNVIDREDIQQEVGLMCYQSDISEEDEEEEEANALGFWKQLSYLFMLLFAASVIVCAWIYLKKPKLVVREVIIEKEGTISSLVDSSLLEVDNRFEMQGASGKQHATNVDRVATTASSYHVIVGAFKEDSRARILQNRLIKRGYNSLVLRKGSLYIVSIQSFGTKNEAQTYRNKANKDDSLGFTEPLWVFYGVGN